MSSESAAEAVKQAADGADPGWWRGAVIYQIYPRSYQDTDGDGVGDLQGIIDRLPYIASLGVDAVWISPFFTSPMHDFGYDIKDYLSVDPLFGDNAAFDRLIAEAHACGTRVLIDLVLNHTAESHPWFAESRASRRNLKSDWYVWADAKPDGSPPNNWLSVFGGIAWTWDGIRGQYYLHNFLASQPDLNFHNPHVREALLNVVRHWLSRGVDGVRLDTVNFYFCDRELRSNPALPQSEWNSVIAPSVNPYNFQRHVHDKNQPENLEFLRTLRSVLDGFGTRIALGEVGDAQRGLDIMAEYTKDESVLHSCYAFDLLSGSRITAQRVFDVITQYEAKAPGGNPTWSFSNHDVVRHATRWGLTVQGQKTMVTLLVCLRGLACLFQGEELGLPEAELTREQIRDPYGCRFWPRFKGRDGCRTPMPWDSGSPNAGFSQADPWLPVPDSHRPLAVSEQDSDSASMLEHYRQAIALRRRWPVLRTGDLRDTRVDGPVLSFARGGDGGRMFCAFNFSEEPYEIPAPDGEGVRAFGEFERTLSGSLAVGGWSAAVIFFE